MENVLVSNPMLGARGSRASLRVGRVLTGLVVAFLLFDALGKLIPLAVVVEASGRLGFALGLIRPIGLVLAASTLLHLIPRAQFVGALLLTAYLGGATAMLVHAGQVFWFPVVMGAILWLAYGLRNPSLRALFLPPQSR